MLLKAFYILLLFFIQSFCFFFHNQPEADGIEGVMNVYRKTINSVELSGRTIFSRVNFTLRMILVSIFLRKVGC